MIYKSSHSMNTILCRPFVVAYFGVGLDLAWTVGLCLPLRVGLDLARREVACLWHVNFIKMKFDIQ